MGCLISPTQKVWIWNCYHSKTEPLKKGLKLSLDLMVTKTWIWELQPVKAETQKNVSVAALHWFVTFYHLKQPEAHIRASMCHLTWFTTKPVVHTSFRGQDADYVNAMVPTMRLPHNYSRNGCGEKSWRVERSLWRSSGLRAPYKGPALHMTLYSMTFYHSRTVSFVRCIFEY